MKQTTLMHSSILAAIFIAAVIGASMVNGFPGAKPFISVDPVSDKNVGEPFTITGTTNLPAGSEIMVDIHPSSLDFNTGMVSDPKTGAAMRLEDSMAAAGMFTVDKDPDGIAAWSFDVPSTQFLTGEYTAIVFVYDENKPGPGDISSVIKFTVKQGPATPVTGQFIRIDPVGDKNVGDTFAITGTTNLAAGTELLFQVYPLSFETSKDQSGMFSGATGTISVSQGTGGTNTWTADVGLPASYFQPGELLVNVTRFTGDTRKGDFSAGSPSGRTTFIVHTGSGTANTSQYPDMAAVGGILIDPIQDTVRGKLLEVTGKTNLSAGTTLLVKIQPVSAQGGKLAADQKNIENFAAIRVEKGNGINNVFSTSFDTRFLSPADYIITISNVKGDAPDAGSEPGPFSCSQVFNIVTGAAPSGQPAADLSVPSIFINPIYDVTGGNTIMVTGTTNVPPGSQFLVSLIPDSMDEAAINKSIANPKFSTTISAVRGSEKTNLFSVTVPTKGISPGKYILFVSAEKYEVTGSILVTVK